MVRKNCNCENCVLPALEYERGQIVIHNRHSGKPHVNKIDVLWIIEQAIKDGFGKQIEQKLKEAN